MGIQPVLLYGPGTITEKVKEANKLTTKGNFPDALKTFRHALQVIPLSAAADSTEEKSLLEMIDVCREYVNFTRMEVTRKQLGPQDLARNVELSAYMTCCKVQSKTHQCLALQLAMTTSYKNQNFVTAASFAKHLIQGSYGEQGARVLPTAR